MAYTLTKTFRFESAHRLSKGYVGKCSNIHGHSWNGHLAVVCNALDEHDMGFDYARLGAFLKEMETYYDHRLWLCKDDPILKELPASVQATAVIFGDNPTSETLAKVLYNKATVHFYKDIISGRLSIKHVQVEETCTTSCRYS